MARRTGGNGCRLVDDGLMGILANHYGHWTGTNGFRLAPHEPFYEAAASARVASGAGGHLARVEYTWTHPEDGDREGLLLLGRGTGDNTLVALWADSWHQQPVPLIMAGQVEADLVWSVEAKYHHEWAWRIVVETPPGVLRITMDNIVPASGGTEGLPTGPYPAMLAELRRHDV